MKKLTSTIGAIALALVGAASAPSVVQSVADAQTQQVADAKTAGSGSTEQQPTAAGKSVPDFVYAMSEYDMQNRYKMVYNKSYRKRCWTTHYGFNKIKHGRRTRRAHRRA